MDIVSAILLGAVQGLTEFLPISSSGHLIILRELLGIPLAHSLAFDAVLQLATTCAVVVYFLRDFVELISVRDEKNNKILVSIVCATIPAVAVGFFFEQYIDAWFRNIDTVVWALIAGSILFFIAEKYSTHSALANTPDNKHNEISLGRGIVVGFFQVLAFIPGISRSGATISGGLLAGFSRHEAVRFSFLLSVPILLGSGLKKLLDLGALQAIDASLVVGSITAFFVGLTAIHFLIIYLRRHTLTLFIIYRVLLALVIVLFL